MNTPFLRCLWIATLIVSCDKPQDVDHAVSVKKSKPNSTRANRPVRETVEIRKDKFRAFLQAAMKIESQETRDEVLASLVRDALKDAPDISSEAFQQISADSKERVLLLQFCIKSLVEKNPDEALTWALTLGSEKNITMAKGRVALFLVDSDPSRAADLISGEGIGIKSQGGGIGAYVFRRWVAKAPADATAWAEARPSGESRRGGLKIIVSQWIETDSPAVCAWLAKMTDESVRKDAIHAMAEVLVPAAPPTREAWLETADPRIRAEIEQQVEQMTNDAVQADSSETEAPSIPAE